jgi:CDP-6-deoxy-D-xylo-4-hexulose-3-dehydrase
MLGSEFLTRSSDYRGRRHSLMNLPFLLTRDAPTDVRAVRAVLEECGVETRPIIAGNLVRHPANQRIAHRVAPDLRFCDELFERGFMIGCHPIVDDRELETLGNAIRQVGERCR